MLNVVHNYQLSELKIKIMAKNEICRTCLNMYINAHKFYDIFTSHTSNKLIFEVLMEHTPIKVEKDDTLPINICHSCLEKLNIMCDFKSMVIESDKVLRITSNKSVEKLNQDSANLKSSSEERDFVKVESSGFENEESVCNENANEVDVSCVSVTVDGIDLKSNLSENKEESAPEIVRNISKNKRAKRPIRKVRKKNCKVVEYDSESTDSQENDLFDDIDYQQQSEAKQKKTNFCEICNQSFKSLRNYKIHNAQHSESKFYKCEVCDKKYTKLWLLDLHNSVHVKMNDVENNEEIENAVEQLKQLDFEANKSKKEKKKSNYCSECNKTFRNSYRLKIHNTKHTGIKPYKCEDCHKSFAQQWVLKVHRRVHTGEQPYACEICGKKFKFMSALPNHMRTHTGDQPYKCDVCNKSFSQMGAVKVHMRIHTGEKPFVCEICGKSFAESARLSRHITTHETDKTYPCPTCGKLFSNQLYVKTHMKTHIGAKPFACDICFKRFTIKASLRTHMLIHQGEKPHSCQICGKRFTQLSCIGRHMRIHTGQTPYPCTECPRAFKYSHHLQNHMKVHK